jgi:glycerophosphoryl diester phosphodiesterase
VRFLAVWAASQLAYHSTARPRSKTLVRIAHRGGAAYAPENTLEACREGIRLGADYLETDVRRTRDGRLVLMHDSLLWRTTGRSGRVEEVPYDPSLPSFDDFLALAREHGIGVLPEIKGQGIEAEVVAAIYRHGMESRTVVPSFSPETLQEIHRLAPEIPLCQLLYPWEVWLRPLPHYISIVAPMAEALLLNPWIVRRAHSRGLKVWPWFAGLENGLTVAYLRRLGVDGMIVDDPARLQQTLSRT